MPPWLMPALSGSIDITGGFVNANQNKKAAYRQERINKSLMDYQADIEHKFWLEQNQYNSPSALMSRYRSAGLNPNLLQNGDFTAASAAPDVSGGSASAEAAHWNLDGSRLINAYTSASQLQEYQKTQEAQRQLIYSQVDKNFADTATAILSNKKLRLESPYWSQNAKYNSSLLQSQLINSKLQSQSALFDNLVTKPLQARNLQTNNDLLHSQIAKVKEDILSVKQDRTLSYLERKLQIDLLSKQLKWYDKVQNAQNRLINTQIIGNLLDNSFNRKSMQNRLNLGKYQADFQRMNNQYEIYDRAMNRISQSITGLFGRGITNFPDNIYLTTRNLLRY